MKYTSRKRFFYLATGAFVLLFILHLKSLSNLRHDLAEARKELVELRQGRVTNLPAIPSVTHKPFFLSYAQDYEDFILYNLFENKTDGFYIDVGANDPVFFSVTKLFYEIGWRGINIEPLVNHCNSLQKDRPRDINLCLAIADKPGNLTLYENNLRTTLDPNVAKRWRRTPRKRVVKVVTLSDVCNDYCSSGTTIDFLKVDVENKEGQVLAAANFGKYRPRVVVVESWQTAPRWDSLLQHNNYKYMGKFFRNRYYIDNTDSELIQKFKTYDQLLDMYVLSRQFPP